MQKIENQWLNRALGLQDVPILHQVRASDEITACIDATVAAHFAGKGDVIGPKDASGGLRVFGNNIAHSLKARERITERDPANPKRITYRYGEVKAAEKHVHTAIYNTKSDLGTEEDLDGNLVKPWVHLVFEDGSQVDLLAVKPPKPDKKAKGDTKDA